MDLDFVVGWQRTVGGRVSIPRSEFCGFRLDWADGREPAKPVSVSIPRSEFCGFRRRDRRGTGRALWFQFLDRNSVDLDLGHLLGKPVQEPFQFLDRNSVDLDYKGPA